MTSKMVRNANLGQELVRLAKEERDARMLLLTHVKAIHMVLHAKSKSQVETLANENLYSQMKTLQNHCDASVRKYSTEVATMVAAAISARKKAVQAKKKKLEAKRREERPTKLLALMDDFETIVNSNARASRNERSEERFRSLFNRSVGRLRQFEGITADLLAQTRAGKRLKKLTKVLRSEYLEQVQVIIKAWKHCARKTLSPTTPSPKKRSRDAIAKAVYLSKSKRKKQSK